MVLAHTIVDAPNHGANSRAAAISAPSDAAPTTKTTISRRRPGRGPVGAGPCAASVTAITVVGDPLARLGRPARRGQRRRYRAAIGGEGTSDGTPGVDHDPARPPLPDRRPADR